MNDMLVMLFKYCGVIYLKFSKVFAMIAVKFIEKANNAEMAGDSPSFEIELRFHCVDEKRSLWFGTL